jgi:PAS domain-containing protein
MNHTFPPSNAPFVKGVDCQATLARLIGNLGGFLYRRRPDARWTMEFVSSGCRDVTGYDPHRFIANASLAFGDLIARADRPRVNERVRWAALHRQRATVEYRIRTAHGAWVQVEDRLTPIVNAAGQVLAIEGIIDRARCGHLTTGTSLPASDHARLAALCPSPSSN